MSDAPTSPTLDEILARGARHGLALRPDGAQLEHTGLDFVVAQVEDVAGTSWILRAPRRPELAAVIEVEGRRLAAIRPHLTVAVPAWRIQAPDLVAYPRLPGRPVVVAGEAGPVWYRIDPAHPDPGFLTALTRVIAELLAAPLDGLRDAGVATRSMADIRTELGRTFDLARPVLAPPDDVWARWQEWLARDDGWPAEPALVHGDLHPGNLLVDEDAKLTGVIDWTEARIDDPAIDLAMLFGCFGRTVLDEALATLAADVDPAWAVRAPHVIERWAAFPATVAAWCIQAGNESALDMARGMLTTLPPRA